MKQFDYLVLGSGLAGLSFALKVAPRGRVAPRMILFYRSDERYGLALETAVNPEIGTKGD
jgi:succinate dehydrogenase/fumarate reductase flavoprotein subunit